MNYIYDILLNYNDYAYDIFEWNKNDKITHVRKIPLIKLKTYDLLNFINKNIKLDSDFLLKIYKKTELFNKKNIDYAFVGTDGKIVIAFKIEKGKMKYSQLFLDEENEVLDFSVNLNFTDIKYNVINSKNRDYLVTRNEKMMKKYIYDELKKIKDIEKLNFLYLECFNKKSENVIIDIYKDLNSNFDNIYVKFYKILKMTMIKR